MIQDPHPGMKIRTNKPVGAIPLGAMGTITLVVREKDQCKLLIHWDDRTLPNYYSFFCHDLELIEVPLPIR